MESAERVEKECLAARSNCVLLEHASVRILEVRNRDRSEFLHRILTNDIKNLKAGKGGYACLLNAQAKVMAEMSVLCFDYFLLLITQP